MKTITREAGGKAKRPEGFTLVEALLCVFLLAVLFALLRVAFQSAAEASRAAACLTNLRTIGAAAAVLIAENNGNLPEQRFNRQPNGVVERLGLSVSYIGDTVLTCPVLRREFPPKPTTYHHRSYSINCIATIDYKKGRKNIQRFKNPAGTLFILDGPVNPVGRNTPGFDFHFGTLNLPEFEDRFTFPHRGRCQALFLDGHVEGIEPRQLMDWSTTSPLWYGE